MATLRRRADGRFFIDYVENGQRKREAVTVDGVAIRDPVIAAAMFAEWCDCQPDEIAQDSPRIVAVLNYYQDTHLAATNAAQATRKAARTHCEAFQTYCRAQHIGVCQQLSAEVLARWSVELQQRVGARTAKNYLTTIRTAINVALESGILDRSPVVKWTLPKVDPVEKKPLTLEELQQVIAVFEGYPIVQWIALTGNRPSDAWTLKFSQVDVPSRTVDRGSQKPRALRKYEICDAAALLVAQAAQRQHGPDDVVFLTANGTPYNAKSLNRLVKLRMARSGFPRRVTPKVLRDSFATIMANDIGVPLPELQVLMGHTSIVTTMKYVRARGARAWLEMFGERL